jgi:hypothetical protein
MKRVGIFTLKFEETLSFVCRLHAEQTRKRTDTPQYLPPHLMLHDVIEDQ